MWKPPILLCSTASRPSARSSPYSGKKCATGWRAANRSPQPLALTPDVLALPLATAGVERGAGGRAVADPPPAVGRHGGGKRLADGAAAERGGRARHRQLFAAARGAGRLAGAACADIADPCRTPSGSAETQSAAGSSPSGGGLRRRAGVRRGMPRWLWRYWQGQTACWTIAIWRVRPRRRNRPAGPSITAGFRRRKR